MFALLRGAAAISFYSYIGMSTAVALGLDWIASGTNDVSYYFSRDTATATLLHLGCSRCGCSRCY